MISEKTARQIALAMPEAEEGEHMDHPDFRVRNKIFATLWPAEGNAVVMIDPESHDELLHDYPKAFSLNGWSKQGALTVHLERVPRGLFQSLIKESWARRAPKTLVAEHAARESGTRKASEQS